MKLEDLELKELINIAEDNYACEEALAFLKTASSMEQVMLHEDAPELIRYLTAKMRMNSITGSHEQASSTTVAPWAWS